MASARRVLIGLIDDGVIPPDRVAEALSVVGVTPTPATWLKFLDRTLLWLGGLALGSAAIFFVAFNWADLGRFAKFAMAETSLVLAVLAFLKWGGRPIAAQASLTVAAILVGVLLALYGQTYQTGADSWQLFFTWAMLVLPWAVVGRFGALWLLWLVLVNLAIVLYDQAFPLSIGSGAGDELDTTWIVFGFNTLALLVWEVQARVGYRMTGRTVPRVLATASGISVTWLVLMAIFDAAPGAWTAWVAWLALFYGVYRKLIPNLFMLAGACFSVIAVVVTYFGNNLVGDDEGGLLVLTILLVGLASASAKWLRKIQLEIRA